MSAVRAQTAKGWNKAKLTDLLTVIRGVTYKKENASKEPKAGHIPIIRANNIQNGLVFEDLVYVPESCVSETQMLRSGDIVIAASSGSRNIVGKAAQLTTDWRGSFGAFCFGLRPKPGVHSGYLAWFLQTSEYRRQVSELSAGVNINNLRASHIEEIPIPVAPLSDQRQIVAEIEKQFSRLEEGVGALRRVQANLKRYRAAVLKAACEGRLVPTEDELAKAKKRKFETGEELLARILAERRKNWQGRGKYKEPAAPDTSKLGKLPDGWTSTSLSSLAELENGDRSKNYPSRSAFVENGIPFINAGHLEGGCIQMDKMNFVSIQCFEQLRAGKVRNGDLLFCLRGSLGKVALVDNIEKGAIASSLIIVRPVREITSKFLLCYLSGWYAQQMIAKYDNGSAQPNLSGADLAKFVVPLPPLAEQSRIVAEVERRLSVVEELDAAVEANLQRATRLRQSILQKAFEGKLA